MEDLGHERAGSCAEGVGGEEADQARGAGQQDVVKSAGAGRACLRVAGERHGRNTGAQHRGHAGAGPDRLEESGLQHAEIDVPGDRGPGYRADHSLQEKSAVPGTGPAGGAGQGESQASQSSVTSISAQFRREYSALPFPSSDQQVRVASHMPRSPRIGHYSRFPSFPGRHHPAVSGRVVSSSCRVSIGQSGQSGSTVPIRTRGTSGVIVLGMT